MTCQKCIDREWRLFELEMEMDACLYGWGVSEEQDEMLAERMSDADFESTRLGYEKCSCAK